MVPLTLHFFSFDYDISFIFWIFLISSIILSSLMSFFKSNNKISKIPMVLGHVGLATLIFGILIVNKYDIEKDIALRVGESVKLDAFQVKFSDVKKIKGSNYVGHKGIFTIKKENVFIENIYPEKRLFIVQEIGMSETAIFTNFFYDIYIAITTPLNDSKTWAVRIYYKPCVRFIWLGGIIICISGLFTLFLFYERKLKQKSRISKLH